MAGRESNFSAVHGAEAQGECRSAIDAMKQSPLYNCRCRRGMKKEKNCLRIFWSIYQSLQGNSCAFIVALIKITQVKASLHVSPELINVLM